jgi:ABC-type glycerol-3-phosphate transport system permease component
MSKSNSIVAATSNALPAAAPARRSRGWRRDWPLNLGLLFLAFMTYLPFWMLIQQSFKDNTQYFSQFWLPALPLHFENYVQAAPIIWKTMLNTLVYAAPTLLLVLAISGITGFAFARYQFPGKDAIFMAMLLLIMLPGILLVIPMFTQIVAMGWTNSIQAVVLPWVAVQIPFGMYLMRTFFETLPREYFEAARLDGASEGQLFLRIALPLAMPAFSTLGILTLLFTWNDIIWPLIVLLDTTRYPISIGVLSFSNSYTSNYGVTFAGYVLASLPLVVVFIFTVRRFMAGLQGGYR